MACTLSPEDVKRVKGLGFLNNKGTDCFNARVITVNGTITAEQVMNIAEAAKKYGNGEVEFTTRLTVEVRGIHYDNIEAFRKHLAEAGLETGGTGSLVRPVVSCKGTTCQYGLYDTFALSQKIHERFYKGYHTVKLPHKLKIATGGCPNNCVKPDLNDIGIVGQLKPIVDDDMCSDCAKCQVQAACPMGAVEVKDGSISIDENKCNNCGRCIGTCNFDCIEEGTPGYIMYIGGRWGKKVNHGRKINKLFTSEEEILNTIEKAILLYREQGKTGERFADTIERIGFEEVERQIIEDDILTRKQQILEANLHMVGGATC